ncbi:MAG: hypothetical protein M3P96_05860 [Actinomycetota bacterium]|nr:hypothetical protein [Actinomycetota bacterium]
MAVLVVLGQFLLVHVLVAVRDPVVVVVVLVLGVLVVVLQMRVLMHRALVLVDVGLLSLGHRTFSLPCPAGAAPRRV